MLHANTPPHKGGVFAFPTTTARPLIHPHSHHSQLLLRVRQCRRSRAPRGIVAAGTRSARGRQCACEYRGASAAGVVGGHGAAADAGTAARCADGRSAARAAGGTGRPRNRRRLRESRSHAEPSSARIAAARLAQMRFRTAAELAHYRNGRAARACGIVTASGSGRARRTGRFSCRSRMKPARSV